MEKNAEGNEKEKELKYQVQFERVDQKSKLAYGNLKKPAGLPPRYDLEVAGYSSPVPVVFDVQDCTEDNKKCFAMMRDLHHCNILHARVVMIYEPPSRSSGEQKLFAWLEPYTGSLIDYISTIVTVHTLLGQKIPLPPELKKIVRQIVDGIEFLRLSGYYHGNFSLESTFYYKDKISGEVTVKLTNFKDGGSKTKSRSVMQNGDWHDVGRELKRISQIAKQRNAELGYERFDCCQLDDLADMLLQAARGDLETVHQNVLDSIFFWEKKQRKQFFVYRIPLALKDEGFISKLQNCTDLCPLPWGSDADMSDLVQLMDQYRASINEKPYNKKSNIQFVECVSGMYAHQHLLNEPVDARVQMDHHGLCWKLYSLLARPTTDKRWL